MFRSSAVVGGDRELAALTRLTASQPTGRGGVAIVDGPIVHTHHRPDPYAIDAFFS